MAFIRTLQRLNDLHDCHYIDYLSIWAVLNVWWWNHSETISCQLPFGSEIQPQHESICFPGLMVYQWTPALVGISWGWAGLSLWGSLSVGMKSVSAQVGWWGAVHTIPSSAPLSANENWPSDLFSSFLRQWTWQRSWNSICKSLLTMSNRAHERHGLHDANWIMGLRLTLRRLHQSASAWAIPVTRATDLF